MGIFSAVTRVISKVATKVAPTAKKVVSKAAKKGASIFTSSSAASKTTKAVSSGSKGIGSVLKHAWQGIKSAVKPLIKPVLKTGAKALRVCKPFLKKIPFVGIALTAIIDGPEIYNAYKENDEEGKKEVLGVGKELGCTGVGMAIGALIGSVVPVLGTAIGAGIGGTIGGIVGMFVRGKTYSERQEDKLLAQQEQEKEQQDAKPVSEPTPEPVPEPVHEPTPEPEPEPPTTVEPAPDPVSINPSSPVAQVPQTPTSDNQEEIPEQNPATPEKQGADTQPTDIISKDQYNMFMMQYYAQVMQMIQMQQAMLMSAYNGYPTMGTPFLGLTIQQPYIGQSVPHIQYAA